MGIEGDTGNTKISTDCKKKKKKKIASQSHKKRQIGYKREGYLVSKDARF
jgi:hypothetical protein